MDIQQQLQVAHQDQRRTITEAVLPNGGAVQQFEVHSQCVLGNHYHTRRTETFVVMQGVGILITQQLHPDGRPMTAAPQSTALAPGSVVHVPPYTAHAFILSSGAVMVCYSSHAYTPKDPDMHSYKLTG